MLSLPAWAAIYNVKDFGAIGNGQNIDSPAINAAIDQASQNGGGTIYLPAGEYRCYSIRLKSNITLYIESGATIVAAFPGPEPHLGYDSPEPNPENPCQPVWFVVWSMET